MNSTQLETITITDFRSIGGSIPIPLSAPVVLLHGSNGAGKSTVMSALELALGGAISGVEEGEQIHLVHRGATNATIDLASDVGNARFTIDSGGVEGDALLPSEDARFLRERCYLQQRTLGRLLEVYEEARRDGESMLTEFVNDLLGIDELEALIDGLVAVRDKRLVKRLVPAYRDCEQEIEDRQGTIEALGGDLQRARREAAEERDGLATVMADLDAPPTIATDAGSVLAWLEERGTVEDEQLISMLASQREVSALARRADTLAHRIGAEEVAALEARAAKAGAAAAGWREADGAALEALLDRLRRTLPGVPAAAGAADPGAICAEAQDAVEEEISRLSETVAADDRGRDQATRAEEALAANRLRLEGIDRQLAAPSTADAPEELARALAVLIPHVHTEDCPVCGRNYSELGSEPLSARLTTRISELTTQAEQLREAASARLEALSEQRTLEEQLASAARQRMEPAARGERESTLADLERARAGLSELKDGAEAGATLIRAETEAERDLARAQESDRASVEIREEVEKLATSIGRQVEAATPLGVVVDTLADDLSERISTLEMRSASRAQARARHQRVIEAATDEKRCVTELARERGALERAEASAAEVERRRGAMRELRGAAEAAREQIVRRVFTDTLNHAWRDLFVRLAPEEPFVPAFQVPEGSGGVSARLETVHRDGKPGGSPAAMLSAGNLNTAALTLFLALNLSVSARLPWLLLDDPVQSMDEVHVSQFAALLRRLTTSQGRRIVLAVHERALFEYLKLELSPAGPKEPLITVELTRGADGSTSADPRFHTFVEDRALVSA